MSHKSDNNIVLIRSCTTQIKISVNLISVTPDGHWILFYALPKSLRRFIIKSNVNVLINYVGSRFKCYIQSYCIRHMKSGIRRMYRSVITCIHYTYRYVITCIHYTYRYVITCIDLYYMYRSTLHVHITFIDLHYMYILHV